jgi:putative transposase
MQIAHKIELKSNHAQETYFKKACGVSRFAWNWALAEWNKQYDQIKLDETKRRIKIPNLGWVKMREKLRFNGKINSVVISRTADRWFASIQVATPIQYPKHENQVSVGIDLGITQFATLSSGITLEAPKPLKKLLWRLKRQSRKLSRKTLGSNHSHKQCERLARLHMRIANMRKDTWIAI